MKNVCCSRVARALQVCHQVAVTWHSGSGAAVVAAAFGVVSLPAIVYQPPNCAEREKPRDDCQWVPVHLLLRWDQHPAKTLLIVRVLMYTVPASDSCANGHMVPLELSFLWEGCA